MGFRFSEAIEDKSEAVGGFRGVEHEHCSPVYRAIVYRQRTRACGLVGLRIDVNWQNRYSETSSKIEGARRGMHIIE